LFFKEAREEMAMMDQKLMLRRETGELAMFEGARPLTVTIWAFVFLTIAMLCLWYVVTSRYAYEVTVNRNGTVIILSRRVFGAFFFPDERRLITKVVELTIVTEIETHGNTINDEKMYAKLQNGDVVYTKYNAKLTARTIARITGIHVTEQEKHGCWCSTDY
jgi:hypothetical protein